VTNSNGPQTTTSHQITIVNPPTASFTGPASALAGTAVSFDGSGSSAPGGSITGYAWSFGDGATSAGGPTTSHTYSSPGTYTVTLTVTDAAGLQSTTSHQITISKAGLGKVKITGNTAAVTITCKGAAACSVTLQLTVTETTQRGVVIAVTAAKKTTKKTVVVGNVSVSLSGGQTKTVPVSLNQAGRRLLARFHKLKATLALTSAGTTVSHATVSFKAKPKKK
jgi:PKD repeat protein